MGLLYYYFQFLFKWNYFAELRLVGLVLSREPYWCRFFSPFCCLSNVKELKGSKSTDISQEKVAHFTTFCLDHQLIPYGRDVTNTQSVSV